MSGGATAGTATPITSLPYTDSDTSPGVSGLWYRYDGTAALNEVGIFVYTAVASLSLSVFSPDSTTGYPPNDALASVHNRAVQIPVADGIAYYLHVAGAAGAYTISVEAGPTDSVPAGSILINDDVNGPWPVALLDATDGTVLAFRSPFVNGENADVLADGTVLVHDRSAGDLVLYSSQLAEVTRLAGYTTGGARAYIRANSAGTHFYVGKSTGASTSSVTTVTAAGAFGPTTWHLTAGFLTACAANVAETILYYNVGAVGNAPIKRWDLLTDSALSDLVTGQGAMWNTRDDVLVLTDDTVVVGYENTTAATAPKVLRYDAAGATLNTYTITGARSTDLRLATARDDPTSFWVWAKLANGISRFQNLKASDGTVLTTFDAVQFEDGIYAGTETATPLARFGHSESCPFLILRAPLAESLTIAVTGYVLPPRHLEALCRGVMTLAALSPDARQRIINALGTVSPGCLLYTYESGTTTPLATYSDSALSVALPNPIVADSSGLFPAIYLLPAAYSFVLRNSLGELIWDADPVQDVGALLQATLTTLQATVTALGAASETKFCTTQFNAVTGTTGATLTDVVGLTGFTLAAAGVYKFDMNLSGVSTVNCGLKIGFGLTTATLTNFESLAEGYTASAVAVQHTTTATTGMTLFGQTAAVIGARISGRITVNAAGTLAVQAAQNAAHTDTTSVYVGSWATLTKIS